MTFGYSSSVYYSSHYNVDCQIKYSLIYEDSYATFKKNVNDMEYSRIHATLRVFRPTNIAITISSKGLWAKGDSKKFMERGVYSWMEDVFGIFGVVVYTERIY